MPLTRGKVPPEALWVLKNRVTLPVGMTPASSAGDALTVIRKIGSNLLEIPSLVVQYPFTAEHGMGFGLIALLLGTVQSPPAETARSGASEPTAAPTNEARIRELIGTISRSGQVLTIADAKQRLADPRKEIAPGAPPLLSFRYFEGAERHRFGRLDVMMDDAGH